MESNKSFSDLYLIVECLDNVWDFMDMHKNIIWQEISPYSGQYTLVKF